jgi:hypothetical protein
MKLDKPAVDFHTLDVDEGWEPAPGAAPGIEQKLLSGALDETNKVGARTRLIRFRARPVRPRLLGGGLSDRGRADRRQRREGRWRHSLRAAELCLPAAGDVSWPVHLQGRLPVSGDPVLRVTPDNTAIRAGLTKTRP